MSEAAVISRHYVHEAVPNSVGRVLIIDDEAEIRESLETLLELEGYQVTTAATGTEGTLRAGEGSYDVVLLEADDRTGGKIHTTPFAGMAVDEAADAFLARVPWAQPSARRRTWRPARR